MQKLQKMQQYESSQEDNDDYDEGSASDTNSLEHYEEGVTSEGKKFHRCTFPDCGKVFRFKSEISRHLVIHFPNRPYQCKHKGCKKTFKRIDALENHTRIHTKTMPFICDSPGCGQKFTTKAGLRYHHLKHNNERPYKCTFPGCGKSFLTASQLKQHEKASVYHWRISNKQRSEDQQSPEEESYAEPYPQIQKYVHMNEERYIPQEKQEDIPEQYLEQQDFQKMLKYVLRENKLLGDRIDICGKVVNTIQEKCEIKSEYDSTQYESVRNDPSIFFNQNEAVLLDYIRSKSENPY